MTVRELWDNSEIEIGENLTVKVLDCIIPATIIVFETGINGTEYYLLNTRDYNIECDEGGFEFVEVVNIKGTLVKR